MSGYWAMVTNKIPLKSMQTEYFHVLALLGEAGVDYAAVEFAHDVIPNMGPGGPTSEEDESDLAQRDPDGDLEDADGPSLGGEQALMAYAADTDELWVWHSDERCWLLWNY